MKKAPGTEAEMFWPAGKWAGLSCSNWDFRMCSFRWKVVTMSEIYAITYLRPCSPLFSWARCSVMSHNMAKSHIQFGSEISGKGFPLLCKKTAIPSLSSKIVWGSGSYSATSLLYGRAHLHAPPTSFKNSWNWQWFRPHTRVIFTIFFIVVIISSSSRTFPHRASWCIMQW